MTEKRISVFDFDQFALDHAKKMPVPVNAVTVSAVAAVFAPIIPTTNLVTATITATADADTTTGNVAHGLSYTPTFAIITPIQPQGALKAWSWVSASTTGTNIVFTGNNVTGSGVAGASVQVWFGRLHSLVC